MNEQEWLSERWRSQWMMHTLGTLGLPRTRAGRRRMRLFACGCCRVAWSKIPDDRLKRAVEVAEAFADSRATKEELAAARASVEWMRADSSQFGRLGTGARVAIDMAVATTEPQAYAAAFAMTATTLALAGRHGGGEAGEPFLCGLVRCVFGNPFRPVGFEAAWRTATVAALAAAANEERLEPGGELDPVRLGVLADALEEAGACEEVVGHLRDPGPHMRGCWVADACGARSYC